MTTVQITRDHLRGAISEAIETLDVNASKEGTPTLSADQRKALLTVADTTARVARGDFFLKCGCPAVQAGLVNTGDLEADMPSEVTDFAYYFDENTREFRPDPENHWRTADILEIKD
jgi:hypothetical protein